MPRRARDTETLDLLAWEPPQLVQRYEEQRVRTASLRAKIARGVGETLREQRESREEVARQMGEWLGEDVSKNMLDAYASEAREDHTIPYLRLLALVHVTGDARLLQLGAELFDRAVIESRYLTWVEVGQLADVRDQVNREFDMKRRRAREGGGR